MSSKALLLVAWMAQVVNAFSPQTELGEAAEVRAKNIFQKSPQCTKCCSTYDCGCQKPKSGGNYCTREDDTPQNLKLVHQKACFSKCFSLDANCKSPYHEDLSDVSETGLVYDQGPPVTSGQNSLEATCKPNTPDFEINAPRPQCWYFLDIPEGGCKDAKGKKRPDNVGKSRIWSEDIFSADAAITLENCREKRRRKWAYYCNIEQSQVYMYWQTKAGTLPCSPETGCDPMAPPECFATGCCQRSMFKGTCTGCCRSV